MGDARRQLRSGTVVLGGVGLLAAALTSCSSEPDRRCVDRDSHTAAHGYRVVSDKNCTSGRTGSTWYYGGSSRGGWTEGGSFSKPRKSSGGSGGGHGSGVERGGFGGGHGSSGG
ncbi:hypothetical protein [Streptomyces tropicalis]|uniref:Lipoprotein n=1 Tax=Streptomyces tropicalis TaxID=3034234 RepID=A0ABT6A0X2_9ACTN|nr:hypothetical protein [Streptomyces tropicalis]MDF3298292.1 hypothetical protein [Streptomyces tropicalis]